ncbi:ABC transporter substrate-binding protein [Methylomarinum sp. Ch1-1]|uniref:ABC transporter substrate-binding protein n=1 Tax=Methylomarinum roseum TaxID=3067653 RepID=A0AAU7NY97_9GAMM|nr:ABC transporter substrate-binding protein [Methylomarinum sp. Ch1-1]MDP4521978.1 ABC transporter substrate-binding protein [Methylomarinum sp. Ch1-1]
MRMKQYPGVFLFAVLGVFLAISSAKAADLSAPQMAIQNASNKLKDRLQDPSFTQDFEKITVFVEDAIYPHVDFNRISALVLGKLWRKASSEEKKEFKKEFQTLLVRTYSRAFVEFKDWSVRFLPLNMESGDRKVIVKTEILQPGIQPIAVDYRMLHMKGQWKVYDIIIEGVSLVTNYRTSFKNEVKRSGSLQAVIDRLVKRNVEALASKETS